MNLEKVFTFEKWAALTEQGLGDKALLLEWSKQVREKYRELAEEQKKKKQSKKADEKKNHWQEAVLYIYKSVFNANLNSPQWECFKSAMSIISHAHKKDREHREREQLALQLELIHEEEQLWVSERKPIDDAQLHEQELLLPEQEHCGSEEEYFNLLEEQKETILYK